MYPFYLMGNLRVRRKRAVATGGRERVSGRERILSDFAGISDEYLNNFDYFFLLPGIKRAYLESVCDFCVRFTAQLVIVIIMLQLYVPLQRTENKKSPRHLLCRKHAIRKKDKKSENFPDVSIEIRFISYPCYRANKSAKRPGRGSKM